MVSRFGVGVKELESEEVAIFFASSFGIGVNTADKPESEADTEVEVVFFSIIGVVVGVGIEKIPYSF